MRFLTCVIMIGLIGLASYADNCRRSFYPTYQVQQAVVHHGYAQGYNFQPVQHQTYYYDVDSYYRDKLLLDGFELRLLKALQAKPQYIPVQPVQGQTPDIAKIVDEALQKYRQSSSVDVDAKIRVNGQLQSSSGGTTGDGETLPPPANAGGNQANPGGVPAGLKEVVEAKCLRCHSGNGKHVDLSNLATVSRGVRWEAHGLVNSGVMPKGQGPLPDSEVLLFYQWAIRGQ